MSDKFDRLCMQAEEFLEPLLTDAMNDFGVNPDSKATQSRYQTLLFLSRLNQREGQVVHVRDREKFTEITRLLGTGYVRFSVCEVGIELYGVNVFDELQHREVAELIFKKSHNSYFMEEYQFF